MSEHIPLDDCPLGETICKPSHLVRKCDEKSLYMKLLVAGVCVLVPLGQCVRDKEGRIISGGLFSVGHKDESDRLINDRRPFNGIERRLGWCRLPHGTQFIQLVIPHDSSIRGSSDDVVSYFYTLEHLEAWRGRNVVGSPVFGSDNPSFADDPDQMYMLSFKVVCMGDSNAVDIAQEVHLNGLQNKGCMNDSELFEYSRTFPAGPTFEGVYSEHHIILQLGRNRASGRRLTQEERKKAPPPLRTSTC